MPRTPLLTLTLVILCTTTCASLTLFERPRATRSADIRLTSSSDQIASTFTRDPESNNVYVLTLSPAGNPSQAEFTTCSMPIGGGDVSCAPPIVSSTYADLIAGSMGIQPPPIVYLPAYGKILALYVSGVTGPAGLGAASGANARLVLCNPVDGVCDTGSASPELGDNPGKSNSFVLEVDQAANRAFLVSDDDSGSSLWRCDLGTPASPAISCDTPVVIDTDVGIGATTQPERAAVALGPSGELAMFTPESGSGSDGVFFISCPASASGGSCSSRTLPVTQVKLSSFARSARAVYDSDRDAFVTVALSNANTDRYLLICERAPSSTCIAPTLPFPDMSNIPILSVSQTGYFLAWEQSVGYGSTPVPSLFVADCIVGAASSSISLSDCEVGDATRLSDASSNVPETTGGNLIPARRARTGTSSRASPLSAFRTDILAAPATNLISVLWAFDRTSCSFNSESTPFECIECPAGTAYNVTSNKCALCPEGTFSPRPGLTNCSICQGDDPSQCPQGSTTDTSQSLVSTRPPLAVQLGVNSTTAFEPVVFAFEDSNYRDPGRVERTYIILAFLWIAVASLIAVLFLIFTLITMVSKTRSNRKAAPLAGVVSALESMDIFFRVYPTQVDAGKESKTVVSQRRSPFGGAVALITVFGLIVVIIALSMRFSLDNVTITTSQRPSGISPGSFNRVPRIRATWEVYGTDTETGCVNSTTSSTCSDNVRVTDNLRGSTPTSSACTVVSPSVCRISWTCESCSLIETPTATLELGDKTPFLRTTLLTLETATDGLSFGTEGGSAQVSFLLTPSTSDSVFQRDTDDTTVDPNSIVELTGYQFQTLDFRADSDTPRRTLGFGVTEGKLVSRGQEVDSSSITLVPPPGVPSISVRIRQADFHSITEVRSVESLLSFAGVLGGAISALLGLAALIIKSIERFLSLRRDRQDRDGEGGSDDSDADDLFKDDIELTSTISEDYTLATASASA